MPWNPNFPLGTTAVNQSPIPIQQNWAFLETNISTDHYFNDATAANEGHHKYIQTLNLTPDPAVAAGMSAVSFVRTMGPLATPNIIPSWPHFRNTNYKYRTTLGMSRQFIAAGAPTTINLFTFAGSVDGPICGTFFLYLDSDTDSFATTQYIFDGTRLATSGFNTTGIVITDISPNAVPIPTIMQARITQNGTYNWAFTAMPFGT